MGGPKAAPLPLLMLVLCCLMATQPSVAQPPACPILGTVPMTNLTGASGDDIIKVPAATNTIFNLAPGAYTIELEDVVAGQEAIIHTGQTICIIGQGSSLGDVVVKPATAANLHATIEPTGVFYLEKLTIDGNNAGGGISDVLALGDRTLTTNAVRFTRARDSAIIVTYGLSGTFYESEWIDNNAPGSGGGGAFYAILPDSGAASSFTFAGTTRFSGNKALGTSTTGGRGGAIYWADAGIYTTDKAPRLTATFNGPVEFSNNQARAAGAMYVGGGARVEFKGPTTSFLNNNAAATLANGREAFGGAIYLDQGAATASVTSVEFSSQLTLFQGNQATGDAAGAAGLPSHQAAGSAIYADSRDFSLTPATVQLHFKSGSTRFSSNTVTRSEVSTAYAIGGTVALATSGNTGVLQMFVSSCVAFLDNAVLQPAVAPSTVGVGLAVGDGGLAVTASVAVDTSAGGRLIFGHNLLTTFSIGSPAEKDVVINTDGGINCGGTLKPQGSPTAYSVSCDLCAPACTSFTCDTCTTSPSTCPTDCYGQPSTTVSNAMPWACGNTALGATCTSQCVYGFVGQAVATCNAGSYVVSGSCTGCSASVPTGSGTGITGYSSCSPPLSAGTYSLTTSCVANCQPNQHGGFASCQLSAGVPTWFVRGCVADCTGNPPNVTGLVWQCPNTTISGDTCTAETCEPGFGGGPVTATCLAGSWANTTTGPACKRVACLGSPPSLPTANYSCTSTPIGAACIAKCNDGLSSSGDIFRVCQADGTFGPQQGDAACVDCSANAPNLMVVSAGSFPEGSTNVSATFSFQGPFISGTTSLAAKLNGDLLPSTCTITPPQLTGAVASSTTITVSCHAASALAVGAQSISLVATFTGSNGCSDGSLTVLAHPQITATPVPAPSLSLTPDSSPAKACKPAQGVRGNASATFVFEAKPGAGVSGGVVLGPATASAPGATCTVQRTGTPSSGKLLATCTGELNGLTSIPITATLSATTQGSLAAAATSSVQVALVCCAEARAHAVDPASKPCETCRTSAGSQTVGGVLHQGGLLAGEMLSGDVTPVTCAAGGVVGSITAFCENDNLLRVTVTNPPGSSASLEFLTRCSLPVASCTAPNYYWRKVKGSVLTRTVMDSGDVVLSFGIQMTPNQASCDCSSVYWAVRQAGTFGVGGLC